MNEFFQSIASNPRLPSIDLKPSFLSVSTESMTAPATSSTFSVNQSYSSLVGSVKSLISGKKQIQIDKNHLNGMSQTVLPRIGDGYNSMPEDNLKSKIRKATSMLAVNSADKENNGSSNLKRSASLKKRRRSSCSDKSQLENIIENEHFGSTLPPRALNRKSLKPKNETSDARREQLRKDIAVTRDSVKEMEKTEVKVKTDKDGKRRVSRRKKERRRSSSKVHGNDDEGDSKSEFDSSKKTRRKSVTRRESVTRRPSLSSRNGLNMAMLIHKFLYKTKRSATLKLKDSREEEPVTQEVTLDGIGMNKTTPKKSIPRIQTIQRTDSPKTSNDKNKNLENIPNVKQSTLLGANNIHSWNFLRDQLRSAKVRDAFSIIKFDLKGHHLQILRQLGEGGYSKVYDVFDEKHILYALKVVQVITEDEDLLDNKTKKNMKLVYEKDVMKEIAMLEMFQDTSRVINMLDYEIRTDVSLPLRNDILPAVIEYLYNTTY